MRDAPVIESDPGGWSSWRPDQMVRPARLAWSNPVAGLCLTRKSMRLVPFLWRPSVAEGVMPGLEGVYGERLASEHGAPPAELCRTG